MSVNQSSQVDMSTLVKQIMDMGFTDKQARDALSKFNNDLMPAINFLLTNPEETDTDLARASNIYIVEESLKAPTASEINFDQDLQINQAIENSIRDAGLDFVTYEPLNPESCKRKTGVPVGLKNIGNTCYFNSLIQFYFMIPKLVQEILSYSCHPSHKNLEVSNDGPKKLERMRKDASIKFVENLQKLISSMICSNMKYIDPTKVLHALVDDFGNQILVGDQKDVGEFHLIMVARIEEGLKTKLEYNEKQEEELKIEEKESSPVRRKESTNYTGHKISDDGIVSQLFYAKQIEYLNIPSRGKELKNEVVFGQIILDVHERDLYSAWDASYHSTIDDYLMENITTKASQEIWPLKFPGVLLFQIQRVKYDIETSNSIKINNSFTFPEEIYTDRFLIINKAQCTKLREEMLKLKRKAIILEDHINLFKDYQKSSIPLTKILESIMKFLKKQKNIKGMDEDGASTPDNLILETPDIKKVRKVLRKYKGEAVACIEQMQRQLSEIYKKIEMLYADPNLQKNKYKLHSLLIHDGYAGSGHYYAFVHDIESDKWRKYSDLIITDISFEDVMRDAIGGNGLTSAYCLFYVKEDLLQKTDIPYWGFELDTIHNTVYRNLIPQSIFNEIEIENKKLEEEVTNYHTNTVFNKIKNLYDSRFEEINRIYKENGNNKSESLRLDLINFCFHLKVKGGEAHKKFLLNTCVKEMTQKDIESLGFEDPLYKKLKIHYASLVPLTKFDKDNLAKESIIFTSNYFDAELSVLIVKYLVEHKYVEAFKAIIFQNDYHCMQLCDYQKFIKDCCRTLILKLTSEAKKAFRSNNMDQGFILYSIIGHLAVNVLENNDYIKKVALKRLELIRDEYKTQNKQGFIYNEPKFAEIIKEINMGEALAKIDFEIIPDEIEYIKAKRIAFDPFSWFLCNSFDEPAHKYIRLKEIMEKNPISEWYKISELITRTKSFNEKLFDDAEKKSESFQVRN